MYFPESEFQEEYQKEIQTLNYDENDNQDVVNLDSSGMILDHSGGVVNLDSRGITLDQSVDEHPIPEEISISPSQQEI